MPLITSIKKEGGRFLLHTGEDAPALLDGRTFEESGLGVGDEISERELARLVRLSQYRLARDRALYAVGRREMCREGLVRLLCRVDCPDDVAAAVADEMVAHGFIDDARYAEMAAEYLYTSKRRGERRVVAELCAKGVDRELARSTAAELRPDPSEMLDALLARVRGDELQTQAGLRRTMNRLLREGYEAGDIRAAISRKQANTDNADGTP